jgi:hypothetical protein
MTRRRVPEWWPHVVYGVTITLGIAAEVVKLIDALRGGR